MVPEDVDPVVVNFFLKTTGTHIIKPGVDEKTNSRY